MQIIFIGTGSSRASLNRFYSSIYFKYNSNNLLIDCGDGISQALLKQNIDFNEINNVLITHLHADHFAGIFSLLNQMKLSGKKNKLSVFIYEDLIPVLEKFLSQTYLFREKMKFTLELTPLRNHEKITIDKNFSVEPFQNTHVIPENYPDMYKSLVFASLSLLVKIEGKTIIYTADLGSAEDIKKDSLKNPDILITETTHISTGELADIFNYLSPEVMYLTHLDDTDLEAIGNWVSGLDSVKKSRIKPAEEGMIIK